MKLDFEEFLNENGLKIGDKVKLADTNEIYEIITVDDTYGFLYLESIRFKSHRTIQFLQIIDFEIVKPKKTVGDLTIDECCNKYGCKNCVINKLGLGCDWFNSRTSLNIGKEEFFKKHPLAEPLRTVLEAEFNKEIEE